MVLQLNLTENNDFVLRLATKKPSLKPEPYDNATPMTFMNDLTSRVKAGVEVEGQKSVETNISNTTDWFDRDESLLRAEIAVMATILYFAIFGNGIVLIVLRLRRQKLTRMQWFIAHLAITDLFVAIFNVLPQLIWDITVQFYGTDFLCRAVKYFQVVAMYASSYVLIMAAVDRYLSICHPLTSQTLSPKRIHLMISMAWTASLLFSLPQIFLSSLKHFAGGSYDCYMELDPGWSTQAYVTWIFLSDYAFPFFILAFCYGRICHVVWISVGSKESAVYVSVRTGSQDTSNKTFKMSISFRRMREAPTSSIQSRDRSDAASTTTSSTTSKKPRGHQRGVSRSKVRTIKLTLTVVLCYLLCWAPFFIVQMWTAFDENVSLEHPVIVIIMLLASLNSCTNPWIYLAFSALPCPRSRPSRQASRSWGHSTHVTSGDSNETKTRTSHIDMSHVRLNSRHTSPRAGENRAHVNSKC